MKIGFVSIEDAAGLTPASLHSYYEARALVDQGLEVQYLSPLRGRQSPALFLRRIFSRLFTGRRILPDRDPFIVNGYARQIMRRLGEKPVDVIFSHGTIPISRLDCPVPIVFWSDATFAGMVDFYPGFTRLSRESIRRGNEMEQAALSRAALAFYSSEWAARSCLDNYQIDGTKIKVVPFGANLEKERPLEEIMRIIRARSPQPCRLAFVGNAWTRKGGDLGLGLVEALNGSGLRSELTIIGCHPPGNKPLPEYVKVIGYLDNTTPAGRQAYEQHLAQSHFLILPTRADCSPRVILEANALGVPCIATNVGGIASMVSKDVNGRLFPASAEFVPRAVEYVLGVMRGGPAYHELAVRTIQNHKKGNTWDISARTIKDYLAEILPAIHRM